MSIESFPNGTPRAAVIDVDMHTVVPKRRGHRLILGLMLAGATHVSSYASFGNLAKLQLNK